MLPDISIELQATLDAEYNALAEMLAEQAMEDAEWEMADSFDPYAELDAMFDEDDEEWEH